MELAILRGAGQCLCERSNLAEAWVESTEIGLDAFVDRKELMVWTNSLKDGSPLAGVEVNVLPDNLAGVTGVDGLTRLAFAARQGKGRRRRY